MLFQLADFYDAVIISLCQRLQQRDLINRFGVFVGGLLRGFSVVSLLLSGCEEKAARNAIIAAAKRIAVSFSSIKKFSLLL